MTDGKNAKSCLSERIKAARADGSVFDSGAAGLKVQKKKISPAKGIIASPTKWSPTSDVGSELAAIFSCQTNSNESSVFGCSPPPRSTNPVSRDLQFHRCVLVNPNLTDRHSLREAYAAVMPKI
ncbi:hypothetical protein BSKO_08739 [Bryopsis sp. KO-2023]|nr:hypothetical protein BSKO_08739 [Bryopsis sp. KO-2023]